MTSDPLFEISGIKKWYSTNEGSVLSRLFSDTQYLKAVDNIDLEINKGEIIGLAGQSGCGKSTLGELILNLQEPTGGEIKYKGRDISNFNSSEMKEFRKNVQVIFQDPYESLNPRYTVAQTVAEPLKIHGIGGPEDRDEKTINALEDAGLTPAEDYLDKLPSELSGGERQRVSIARALVLNPEFIVADEPVSMLDVSVRTGLLQLFKELKQKDDLTLLYVSHDLSTINFLADRTMIMYLGNIVEVGDTEQVIHSPSHPYTEALLDSVPESNPDGSRAGTDMEGDVPDPVNLPDHCRFAARCKYASEKCRSKRPKLNKVDDSKDDNSNVHVACFHPIED